MQPVCPPYRCQEMACGAGQETRYKAGFLSSSYGFTLIELIVTMLVVSVLAVMVVPRWSGNSAFDERGFRDSIVAGLRYAQKSAIAAHRRVCVTFTVNSAAFTIAANFADVDCAGGGALIGPDGNVLVVTARGAATFSAVPGDVVFDPAGRPVAGAGVLNFTNLPDWAVTIEPETGYVH